MSIISRKGFVRLYNEAVGNKVYGDQLLTDMLNGWVNTEHFILQYYYNTETVYISYLADDEVPFPAIISWYKLCHIGRGLELVNVHNRKDLKYIIKLLGEELDRKYL